MLAYITGIIFFIFSTNIFAGSYIIIKGKPLSFKDFSKKIVKTDKIPEKLKYRVIKNNTHSFPDINTFSKYLPDPLETQQDWLKYVNAVGIDNISTGKGVLVGVIDSGVELDHEDLKGQVIDYFNVVDNNTDVEDYLGHGTAVLGIMGAIAHNGKGIIGISPSAKYVVVKITHKDEMTFDDYAVAKAIYYLVDKGCKVINMSIQMREKSELIDMAIDYAKSKKVILVASSGNISGKPQTYPASNSYVLGVSSVNREGCISQFSSYDNSTFLYTLGENILTTTIGNSYSYETGTSFSAPMVTATIADLLSLNPFFNLNDMKEIIKKSSNKSKCNEDIKILSIKSSLINTGIRFITNKTQITNGESLEISIILPPMSNYFDLYLGFLTPDDELFLLIYNNSKLSWIKYKDKLIPVLSHIKILNYTSILLFGNNSAIFPEIKITSNIKRGTYKFYGAYIKTGKILGYLNPLKIIVK